MDEKELYGEAFEKAGAHALRAIRGFYETLRESPVFREMPPRSPELLPERGIGLEATMDLVARELLPHAMGIPHPRYLGLVNSSPLPGAVLGDVLTSALNNNAGANHQSPSFSWCEQSVVRSFNKWLGLSPKHAGLILPGGSYANLHGLILARESKFPDYPLTADGEALRPRVYVSEAVHFSANRAVRAAGLGRDAITSIAVRADGSMDIDALRRTIEDDRLHSVHPLAVIATYGTTAIGALDPLDAIAGVCEEHGLWFHVDACYGGAATLLSEFEESWRGAHLADSLAVDLHKWFFLPIAASLVLTPHRQLERDAFEVSASYIPIARSSQPFERSVATSRRATALSAWFALKAHGIRSIRDTVRRNNDLMRLLEQRLASEGFECVEGSRLSIAACRWIRPQWPSEQADRFQVDLRRMIVEKGITWISTVRHADLLWLRFNLVNLYTNESDIEIIANAVIDARNTLARP